MQDILYLSSLNPITIETNPSELSVSFAKELSDSDEFRRGQKTMAKEKYGLRQELLYKNLGKSFYDLDFTDNARRYLGSIPGCNLLESEKQLSLIDSLLLLLSFNVFIDVRYLANKTFPLFAYVSGKEEMLKRVNKYPINKLSAILIPYDTSQNELITWIKENWQSIEEGNKSLGKFVTSGVPKNLELGMEIGELRDQDKTFAEIETILYEKYPDDERLAGDQVKTIYHRYKTYMVESLLAVVRLNFLQ